MCHNFSFTDIHVNKGPGQGCAMKKIFFGADTKEPRSVEDEFVKKKK